jgi:hypothetical protein
MIIEVLSLAAIWIGVFAAIKAVCHIGKKVIK